MKHPEIRRSTALLTTEGNIKWKPLKEWRMKMHEERWEAKQCISNPKMIKVCPRGTHFQKYPPQAHAAPASSGVCRDADYMTGLPSQPCVWCARSIPRPFFCLSTLAAMEKGQLHRIANTFLLGRKIGGTHLQSDKCSRQWGLLLSRLAWVTQWLTTVCVCVLGLVFAVSLAFIYIPKVWYAYHL